MSILARRGRHAERIGADEPAPSSPAVTAEAVRADRQARQELTAQSGIETTVIPGLSGILFRADLAQLPSFRTAFQAVYVRSEPHHCGEQLNQGPAWLEQYAAIWEHRAGDVTAEGYGIGEQSRLIADEISVAHRAARREVLGDADTAQAHADAGFRQATRVFHSEAELMLGVPAAARETAA